jgi:Nuclease-related domain
MRKIKASSNYLKNQVRKNFVKAALCLLIFGAVSFVIILRVLSTLQLGLLEEAGLVSLLVPLVAFYFYLRKYRIYNGGWQGEKQVAKLLTSTLSDDYYLLNDLYLHDGGGDIDHIVLGPNGVFVLETKNWSGNISCNGDEWQRSGKQNFSASPSRQVKRNAAKIQHLIDNSPNLRGLRVWVESILVFTNKRATLHVTNPTVAVLKLPQLPNHITSVRRSSDFSRQKIEAFGQQIIKHKN